MFFNQEINAADYYAIASSATANIDEHGTCRTVENTLGSTLFISTKTSAEWSSCWSGGCASASGANANVGTCTPVVWVYNGGVINSTTSPGEFLIFNGDACTLGATGGVATMNGTGKIPLPDYARQQCMATTGLWNWQQFYTSDPGGAFCPFSYDTLVGPKNADAKRRPCTTPGTYCKTMFSTAAYDRYLCIGGFPFN